MSRLEPQPADPHLPSAVLAAYRQAFSAEYRMTSEQSFDRIAVMFLDTVSLHLE